jgi:hypothetical protein
LIPRVPRSFQGRLTNIESEAVLNGWEGNGSSRGLAYREDRIPRESASAGGVRGYPDPDRLRAGVMLSVPIKSYHLLMIIYFRNCRE